MTFSLPNALQLGHQDEARDHLTRYYDAHPPDHPHGYTGAAFDSWDSTGTRRDDVDRFTADDLTAVSMLSVQVPPRAAYRLRFSEAGDFARMLVTLGPDRDLMNEEAVPEAGWVLHKALDKLPGVGPTIASKLLARKRPMLRPIYDDVVSKVVGSDHIWDPLRVALRDGLHNHLEALVPTSGLGRGISPLRVFDVVAWCEGKAKGY